MTVESVLDGMGDEVVDGGEVLLVVEVVDVDGG